MVSVTMTALATMVVIVVMTAAARAMVMMVDVRDSREAAGAVVVRVVAARAVLSQAAVMAGALKLLATARAAAATARAAAATAVVVRSERTEEGKVRS